MATMINEEFQPVEGQFSDASDEEAEVQEPEAPQFEDFSDEEEDEFDMLEERLLKFSGEGVNISSNVKHFQPHMKASSKYLDKVELGYYNKSSKFQANDKFYKKDKSDRATVENVLDPRTRTILSKLLKDKITTIDGVISTGKEANVYHAMAGENHKAIKIYKTSILTFKDRDRYITGEHRFRSFGKNPRKMIKVWAEKEARNLVRIRNGGVVCPVLDFLKGHVLVMDFIGKDGVPAPLLKDKKGLSESKYRELYLECILIVRKLYHKCNLVHADLSEFNLLYYNGGIVVIDVSQSVEHDHPSALEFLRSDCSNINHFFGKNKVCVLTLQELFTFVTDVTIDNENIDDEVERLMRNAVESGRKYDPKALDVDQEVFKKKFIPRTLHDVDNPVKDIRKKEKGEVLAHENVTGVLFTKKSKDQSEDDSQSEDESADKENMENPEKKKNVVISTKNMTKEEMKAHKKKVKEENRERRTQKMPKHLKKRKEKVTTTKRK